MPAELANYLPPLAQRWGLIAAILGGLAVALGAFGAHRLPKYLEKQQVATEEISRRLANWETAAKYQMYHALALCVVAWLASRSGGTLAENVAGILFLVGVIIFSGCLYLLVLSGEKILGRIVPIGGVAMIGGWIALAVCFLRSGGK